MKIMVYTYAVGGLPSQKAEDLIVKKQKDLETKFPTIKILVAPGPLCDGDKVEMLDFTMPVQQPLTSGGGYSTYPLPIYQQPAVYQQPPIYGTTLPNTFTVTCGGIGIAPAGGYASGGAAGPPGPSKDYNGAY